MISFGVYCWGMRHYNLTCYCWLTEQKKITYAGSVSHYSTWFAELEPTTCWHALVHIYVSWWSWVVSFLRLAKQVCFWFLGSKKWKQHINSRLFQHIRLLCLRNKTFNESKEKENRVSSHQSSWQDWHMNLEALISVLSKFTSEF